MFQNINLTSGQISSSIFTSLFSSNQSDFTFYSGNQLHKNYFSEFTLLLPFISKVSWSGLCWSLSPVCVSSVPLGSPKQLTIFWKAFSGKNTVMSLKSPIKMLKVVKVQKRKKLNRVLKRFRNKQNPRSSLKKKIWLKILTIAKNKSKLKMLLNTFSTRPYFKSPSPESLLYYSCLF